MPGWISGADRDRTDDLLNAIQALSQLSYSPTPRKGGKIGEPGNGATFLPTSQPRVLRRWWLQRQGKGPFAHLDRCDDLTTDRADHIQLSPRPATTIPGHIKPFSFGRDEHPVWFKTGECASHLSHKVRGDIEHSDGRIQDTGNVRARAISRDRYSHWL